MKLAATAGIALAAWTAAGLAGADPPPPSTPKQVIDADGTYAVGKDIMPGTYRSDGPRDGKACYWRRVSDGKIVDSAMTKQPQVVLIEPSDTAFRTDRCQPWQPAQCPPTCAPVPQQSAGLPDILKGFVPQARPSAAAPAPSGG